MNQKIQEQLSFIRIAEESIEAMRLDLCDAWKIVGAMLREIRKANGLRQQDAAELIGRTHAVINRWEKGDVAAVEDVVSYLEKFKTNDQGLATQPAPQMPE